MAQLEEPFPPIVRASYPHMLPEDTQIWTRWLNHHAARISQAWYDVHVGTAVQLPADAPDYLRRVARGLTRKRIDVVAQAPTEMWVIEIKPHGGYTALGQALVYARMFAAEYPQDLPIIPMVICRQIDADLVHDYLRHGVRYEEVGWTQ